MGEQNINKLCKFISYNIVCCSDDKDFVLDDLATLRALREHGKQHERASEPELAEYMGEQNINKLCNSHPILSFEATVVVVPTTKT